MLVIKSCFFLYGFVLHLLFSVARFINKNNTMIKKTQQLFNNLLSYRTILIREKMNQYE